MGFLALEALTILLPDAWIGLLPMNVALKALVNDTLIEGSLSIGLLGICSVSSIWQQIS